MFSLFYIKFNVVFKFMTNYKILYFLKRISMFLYIKTRASPRFARNFDVVKCSNHTFVLNFERLVIYFYETILGVEVGMDD